MYRPKTAGSSLLGAYTLEGLRLAADPLNGRLVPVRGLAMPLEGATLVASFLSPKLPAQLAIGAAFGDGALGLVGRLIVPRQWYNQFETREDEVIYF